VDEQWVRWLVAMLAVLAGAAGYFAGRFMGFVEGRNAALRWHREGRERELALAERERRNRRRQEEDDDVRERAE
jgi:hypothetical protein